MEVEAYGVDALPAVRERELEMLFPHHALRRDLELVAEARRGKSVSPYRRRQQGDRVRSELPGRERAVGFDHALEVGGREQRLRGFLKCFAETAEIGLAQREPGRGGMTTELQNQSGVQHRHPVERVAQDGGPRSNGPSP